MRTLYKRLPRLKVIFAEQAYGGDLEIEVHARFRWLLEIVRRLGKGFKLLPKRWVVERTVAWFAAYRRLSKDDERLVENSETMVKWAMIRLMLNRVA